MTPPQNDQAVSAVPDGDKASESDAVTRSDDIVAEEHVVVRGESLSQIAFRYGASVQTLRALNHIDNPRLIRPGQKIKLPTQ